MLDSGQQTVMDEYAKKLYLPEEHLILQSTMTRELCTRRGKQMTHEELTISCTGFMVEKLKKWHNW